MTGISYDKMRGLLAYLAVEREQDHRREALAELFWSSNDPVTARGNLRRTLSDLRRVLELPFGKPLFAVSKSTIRFIPDAFIDTVAFGERTPLEPPGEESPQERDEKLASLYAGEFMAGFYLPECPDFESWLVVQRQTLHRRALVLLEQLANFHESNGDHARALQFALRYSELEPWDESGHRRVMRLYALHGQTAAALAQFDACWSLLQNEIGLTPGAETRLLAERIRNGEIVRVAPASAVAPAHIVPPQQAERRQVSVLFCELIPSGIDDPEDALELLAAPRARCVEIVQRFSGYLVPMHGGGLLAYFGYPKSREDSAVRAVRAALAISQLAACGIAIRCGVHTGLILTSADPSLPDTVGRTSGFAIQLHRCIGHNEAAISQETHNIVAGYFDCTSLGAQSFPGLVRPVEVFRVDRESGARTRLDAAAHLTPLVGRQDELTQLLALWGKARNGVAQAVLLQGEPAIGKSRLVHAFVQRLPGRPHAVRELRCFPEFSQSPLYPVLALLEAGFGFAPGDSAEAKSAKLAQHVTSAYPSLARDAVPLLIALFALPEAAGYPPSVLSPKKQKQLTTELLRAMLKGPMAQLPLLLIVEDLHWADPSTLEWLAVLGEQEAAEPTLALFTARPGFTLPFAATLLSLAPLAEREVAQLITSVRAELPVATVRRIVERADGIPLFAEELAKAATGDHWTSIPGTLHDLLAARIDQLGDAKHTAQMAAAIGREFDLDLLRRLSPGSPPTLARSLARLVDAGLVGRVDATTFQFKHVLIQEAAYQSQPRADRQLAHRQIALSLQSDYPEIVATRPELLAQHLSSAGEIRASIACWIKAGQRAIQGSANQEAVAHFNAALQLLMTLPASPDRDHAEFSILVGLGPALHATQGYGSEEATRVTGRLGSLRQGVGDSAEEFQAEWTRLRNTMATSGPRGVPQAALRLLDRARDDPIGRQAAHYVAAVATFWLGEFDASRNHAAQAIGLYRPEHHPMMLERFGEDLSVSFAGHLSWALCFLGFPDQAQLVCDRMLAQARAMEHPKTLAMALLFASMLPRWLNQYAPALRLAAEATAVTRDQGLAHWMLTSVALHGWAQVMQEGRQDLTELKAIAVGMGTAAPAYATSHLAALAELHMHLGRFDEALGLLAQVQAAETGTGSSQFAAETHRLRGVCLLARTSADTQAAEASFAQALAVSRAQGAKMLELRATVSLARLWRQQGRRHQALRVLAKAHAWFTEGLHTPDLAEAAELLRALSPE